MTTYGLTSKDVLRIALVTGALGLILLAIEIGVGHAYGTLANHGAMVMAVPVGIALGPPLVIGACGVTDIVLIHDEVQLRLAGRAPGVARCHTRSRARCKRCHRPKLMAASAVTALRWHEEHDFDAGREEEAGSVP